MSVESKLKMAFGRDIKVDTMTMKIEPEEPEEFNLSENLGTPCFRRHVAMSDPVTREEEYREMWQEVTQSLHNSNLSSAQGSTTP